MARRVRRPSRLFRAVALALVVPLLAGATVDVPRYVALGDSYTAGSAIVDLVGEPRDCLRSSFGYPSLVAADLGDTRFGSTTLYDASCSGATTDHLLEPQSVGDAANPPQLDVVTDRTELVTIGIGLNDVGFGLFLSLCFVEVPDGGCRSRFTAGGTDGLRVRIAATAPRVAAAIELVRARAPGAAVFVVGYPTILPADGDCPTVATPADDIVYLQGVLSDLNAMLASQARAHGADFVDTASSSVGHDACAGIDAWVNGPHPGVDGQGRRDGTAFHPNAAGHRHTAALVTAAVKGVTGS